MFCVFFALLKHSPILYTDMQHVVVRHTAGLSPTDKKEPLSGETTTALFSHVPHSSYS